MLLGEMGTTASNIITTSLSNPHLLLVKAHAVSLLGTSAVTKHSYVAEPCTSLRKT